MAVFTPHTHKHPEPCYKPAVTFLPAESISYKRPLLLHVARTAALRNLLGCITGPAVAHLALRLLQNGCRKRVRAQALEKLPVNQ